jgi:hypothetical protein
MAVNKKSRENLEANKTRQKWSHECKGPGADKCHFESSSFLRSIK